MRQLFIFGAIFLGLLVVFGLAGEGGLRTAKPAEATETTTTWMYTNSGAGIQVGSGPSEGTAIVPAPCTSCYITQIVPDMVYWSDPDPLNHPNGTTANFNNGSIHGAWLHHMVVGDYPITCPITRTFASGNERTTWSVPAGYGHYQTCANWYVNYHIHNNSSATPRVAPLLLWMW